MDGGGEIAVAGYQSEQYEEHGIVENLQTREVGDETSWRGEGSQFVLKHQVSQQEVLPLTQLLGLQGGEKTAHAGQPWSSWSSV